MYAKVFKRALDVVAATILLILVSPALLLTALAIRAGDGGPAIFKQQRIGRGAIPFTIYKFRSMPLGTPNLPSASAQSLQLTPMGRFIRRTNIDELPQLWNVLKGDMSLVGPRPALPSQTFLIEGRRDLGIFRLRPGLTGLAQVNAYDGMLETEKLEWERRYNAQVSCSSDLCVLLRTVGYVLRRPPTY